MTNKNCELLFEYLRSILYDPSIHTLDISTLEEPYQKLGYGLQFLEKAVSEMKAYSASLATGNLSAEFPSRDNFLCENLKSIHANLNHLTWQAKQVAKGDYSQTVSYLGEFSEAFNTMTKQLRERELSLKQEALRQQEHANMLDGYNQLLLQLIDHSNEDILVTSLDQKEILYCSQPIKEAVLKPEIYEICMNHLNKENPHFLTKSAYEKIWETTDSKEHTYRITTVLMEWQGQQAYSHIILDITEEKKREEKLAAEAYHDPLTGIGNRLFFNEQMEELLSSKQKLTFCYCDLDHLKYVNDTFGHLEGDWYIRYFVNTVKEQLHKEDIFCRIGGDEFCIVMRDCSLTIAKEKFTYMQMIFRHEKTKPYPKNFSFGIIEIPENHSFIHENDIIKRADEIMYQQKKLHKQKYQKMLASENADKKKNDKN